MLFLLLYNYDHALSDQVSDLDYIDDIFLSFRINMLVLIVKIRSALFQKREFLDYL